jgi:MoaA/NifB/PqqE/SkfB family radical SAM enzyme
MAVQIMSKTMLRAKREVAERILGRALGLLGDNPEKNAKYVIKAIDHFIGNDPKRAITRDWIHNWLREGGPGRDWLGRILQNIDPGVRRRYIARMFISMFFRDHEVNERCQREYGINSPHVMLISPTMRCNYRCEGCYAASYERKDDMPPEVFDRLLSEAEELDMNFFIILGGEPFIYPNLLDVIQKHHRSFFQVYTNASFIDKAMAEKLVKLGNVAPQISINGPGEYTNKSRMPHAYDKCLEAMDNLREAGGCFGFSTLVTRHNLDAICEESWIDLLIEKGALYGWLFLYMPIGGDPDPDLMPTPEQRNKMRVAMRKYRQTKPIIPLDFWNDGVLTCGCISGGREYFHINHRGDVEPCIFNHFATHNIYDCSLVEALACPFFKEFKDTIPFSYNTLRPCPIIDHHQKAWEIIQKHGARPTHEGAEKMYTTLAPFMQQYSERVREIMDDVWDNEDYHEWGPVWGSMCGIPPERYEQRRREYELSRGRQP